MNVTYERSKCLVFIINVFNVNELTLLVNKGLLHLSKSIKN